MSFPTSSALIEFLILAILEKDDSYGYEISQTIKLIANIKESTLYPILKKLEQNDCLTTYSQEYQGRKTKILFTHYLRARTATHSKRRVANLYHDHQRYHRREHPS